ncbi:MAG: DNA-3-methyladenine glycosylase 2 family protein [Verrucomicrobiales bacterium]|nr:DNA-3-methyladenine glycosylase 2 family protein [Verrucomicrobiales bacterium]MCP5557540.1 DNA-3-methyladenine glycosylase 2 family protein [Verrucomicrobiaceae bacterium]
MKLDDESCYAAFTAGEARFDGVFFTGVKSTGIYCRPVCAARKPLRRSCTFYRTASEAEGAGFRPCLRCRPELAPAVAGDSMPEALLRRIQERAVEGTRLSDLEADLGYSPRQVRRILVETFGVTPVQVVQTQRLLLARQLLRETRQPVSEIALAAGFRSLRNFNALFAQRYGCAPGECRGVNKAGKDAGTVQLRLAYRAPMPWDALMVYFKSRLVPGVEEIVGDEYRRTVEIGDRRGWLSVKLDQDRTEMRVTVSQSLFPVLGAVQSRVRRMFDLDARPDAMAVMMETDPLLAPVWEKHAGLRVGGAWDPFELAVRAVLGQQITVAAATTLSGRLVAKVGAEMDTPFPALNRLAVTPDALAKLSVDDLCRLGLVSKRAETLRTLANFALAGGLEFAPGVTHDAVVEAMTKLPGIGPWTAHYIAMRALRFPDAFPAADLGLRKAIGHGEMVSTREAEARSQAWRPWRAYAAIALWFSLSME